MFVETTISDEHWDRTLRIVSKCRNKWLLEEKSRYPTVEEFYDDAFDAISKFIEYEAAR